MSDRMRDSLRGRRSWITHMLLLLGGGCFGAFLAIGLQLTWQLQCGGGAFSTGGRDASCETFAVSLLPTLFGALFGGLAADLIWSRRH